MRENPEITKQWQSDLVFLCSGKQSFERTPWSPLLPSKSSALGYSCIFKKALLWNFGKTPSSSHTPRLAQNKLFLLRINIARFNTRKYIKEYFGAHYFLKVLTFFIFILFSFFKNNWIFSFFFHLKILRKNLESRVQSRFYTMRKPKRYGDIKSRYPTITAAMKNSCIFE